MSWCTWNINTVEVKLGFVDSKLTCNGYIGYFLRLYQEVLKMTSQPPLNSGNKGRPNGRALLSAQPGDTFCRTRSCWTCIASTNASCGASAQQVLLLPLMKTRLWRTATNYIIAFAAAPLSRARA